MLDLSGRSASCQSETKTRSFLKSATVLLITAVIVGALLVAVSGPICESIDRQHAAEKAELSPLTKEIQKRMRGYE